MCFLTILRLGGLKIAHQIQVKLFVHVMAQIYNKDQWTNAIMCVPARVSRITQDEDARLSWSIKRRKFCVGIAFELEDWVVAFVSMDLIIQVRNFGVYVESTICLSYISSSIGTKA